MVLLLTSCVYQGAIRINSRDMRSTFLVTGGGGGGVRFAFRSF